jgi:hypothetical protein
MKNKSASVLRDLLDDVERVERRLRRLCEETTIFSTADSTVSARIERALHDITAIADRLFRLSYSLDNETG